MGHKENLLFHFQKKPKFWNFTYLIRIVLSAFTSMSKDILLWRPLFQLNIEHKLHMNNQMSDIGLHVYTFMALVIGRYECLFTRRSRISRGQSPREIWLLRVNKASYLPTTRAINCLLYRNYTHNKTFFLN